MEHMIAALGVNHKNIIHTCPLHVVSADEMCALLLQSCKKKPPQINKIVPTGHKCSNFYTSGLTEQLHGYILFSNSLILFHQFFTK